MPPLPKRKRSKASVGSHRAHQHQAIGNLIECTHCRQPMKPHHVCPSCGRYRGRDILRIDSDLA